MCTESSLLSKKGRETEIMQLLIFAKRKHEEKSESNKSRTGGK